MAAVRGIPRGSVPQDKMDRCGRGVTTGKGMDLSLQERVDPPTAGALLVERSQVNPGLKGQKAKLHLSLQRRLLTPGPLATLGNR